MPVPSQELLLPIIPTDLRFFHDSFFEESRRHFEMAVKEITDRCGLSSKDPVPSYRSLRQKELKTDNQAVSVTDDVNVRKFVIDVKDFREGELSVKVVDDRLVAEGRVERREGGSTSTHSFRRRFSLPKTVDLESITSTISSDGILTITAPKNKPQQPISEEQMSLESKTNSSDGKTVKSLTTSVINSESHTESHGINKQSMDTQTDSRKPCLGNGKEVPNLDMTCHAKDLGPETPLPLILRGSFFDDSFFGHTHRDFEAAMERVLRSNDISTSTLEAREKYQSLRKDRLVDETQAVTLSEDNTHHKIVLDVQDFKDGDVHVKGVGRSLVVEGRVEKNSDGSVSSHSFRRRFSLPSQAQLSDVTAALSSDGILTILVKKNSESLKESEIKVPIQIVNKVECRGNETISCKKKTEEETKVSSTEEHKTNHKIGKEALSKEEPVEIKPRETKEQKTHLSKELHQKRMESCITKEQRQQSDVCDQSKTTKTQNLPAPKQETKVHSQSDNDKAIATSTLESDGTILSSRYLPLSVESRGDFFQDSFFSNDHKHFHSAVSKVLERYGMKSSIDDDLKSYRALRKSISVEESQAVQISNEETEYKVVMDMRDFMGGDVKVKADGQTLVVEGHTETKEANSSSSRSFRRCFTFPTMVDMGDVTSALSSDGVLTITAPKHIATTRTTDRHEENESRVSTSPQKGPEDLLNSSIRRSTKTTRGWAEQSSFHETSFVGKISQETSSKTCQSSSTLKNIA